MNVMYIMLYCEKLRLTAVWEENIPDFVLRSIEQTKVPLGLLCLLTEIKEHFVRKKVNRIGFLFSSNHLLFHLLLYN